MILSGEFSELAFKEVDLSFIIWFYFCTFLANGKIQSC